MSIIRFWKELVITQTFTGSISLVASSAIVTSTSLNGLSNPYRRILFGLSVSDILHSFAIVFGPFLISDVPQALWSIGNKHTCRFDGFLFMVGMTAVPMYTLSLCIYYVCKLKWRMTDAQIAVQVEKKMHVFIIISNLVLYLTALGLDTINPSVNGSVCLASATPTGCRQNPEVFCDHNSEKVSMVFNVISSMVVPISCLVGTVGCLAIIFFNVILRENIFGRAEDAATASGEGSRTRRERRNRYLRSIDSSAFESSTLILSREVQSQFQASVNEENSNAQLDLCSTQSPQTADLEHQGINENSQMQSPVAAGFVDHDASENGDEHVDSTHQSQSRTTGGNGGQSHRRSSGLYSETRNPHPVVSQISGGRSTVFISRLYKRELVTQACCYVLVFCVTALPYLVINATLLKSQVPSRALFRTTVVLYPLTGFFNMIIYTRPNVASFCRKYPQCSWLQALWLVLKAGGEVPGDDAWNESLAWSFARCCFCWPCLFKKKQNRRKLAQEDPDRANQDFNGGDDNNESDSEMISSSAPMEHANIASQETVSDLRICMPSRPFVPSSMPDSALGMDGMSVSLNSQDPAYRNPEKWEHLKGRDDSKMDFIQEHDEVSSSSSRPNVSNNLVSFPSRGNSQSANRDEQDDDSDEDIWKVAMDRARNWRPSE